jgi:hypothetical protein
MAMPVSKQTVENLFYLDVRRLRVYFSLLHSTFLLAVLGSFCAGMNVSNQGTALLCELYLALGSLGETQSHFWVEARGFGPRWARVFLLPPTYRSYIWKEIDAYIDSSSVVRTNLKRLFLSLDRAELVTFLTHFFSVLRY